MKLALLAVPVFLLTACASTHTAKSARSPEYRMTLPIDVAAALRAGEVLRFGPRNDTLGLARDLEHCGQICHTYTICTPEGCHSEEICVDNPNCDGHKP